MMQLPKAHAWYITWLKPNAAQLKFNSRELSGSLGDLGTFLPLSVALAVICGMNIGVIFIFAGLMNVATGWWFRQPIPVQPMKAIAAVAIAEGLTPGAIASAGMFVGVMVLALALVGGVDWLVRTIPSSVIRGIQAGIGIKLAWQGLSWLGALPATGWDSWLIAGVVGVIVLLSFAKKQPVLLYVFLGGFVLLALGQPDTLTSLSFSLPRVGLVMPEGAQWWQGLFYGAIPQLPLTLLNSVVAVCALSSDYFPGRGIKPRQMASSVGWMNLLCVPFGGMPMCHGAGGLAAQYHFGARTGGSVIMLGGLKILAGLLLGGVLLTTLQSYPVSILAIMVIVAGITLALNARHAFTGQSSIIVIAMVMVILLTNALVAFIVGCLLAAVLAILMRPRKPIT